jgi:hypothetical protein
LPLTLPALLGLLLSVPRFALTVALRLRIAFTRFTGFGTIALRCRRIGAWTAWLLSLGSIA